METRPYAVTEKALAEELKHCGHTWQSFQNVQKLLSQSHQDHYIRSEIGDLHAALEKFRNTKGMALWQRGLKKNLLRQEDSPEEQGFQTIDGTKGDRVYLNGLLLKYARQANETLYEALVAPQLKSPVKNKRQPAPFSIPQEVDAILLTTHPLLCFSMLKEAKAYQQRIQHKTRWLYVETFINRWSFKFNRFALFFQNNLGASLFRIFFKQSLPVKEIQDLYDFLAQIIPEHLREELLPLHQESQNNLRTLYLIFLNLLFFLLEKQVKMPIELHRIFMEFDHVRFFSRKDFLCGGMCADYEKFHPLPNLSRKVSSPEERTLWQTLNKKRFLNFWQRYSQLPSYAAKVDLFSSFMAVDRLFILEQFYRFGRIVELAKLHEHTEKMLNAPEAMSPQERAQVGSQRSKFLRSLWQMVNKYQVAENAQFSKQPEVVQYVHAQFGGKATVAVDSSQFASEVRKQGRKKDWRQLSIHEIPPYTKVKKWTQIARLPFDIPNTDDVLFSFMPYVRINEKRLADRLTIAHCVELVRLPFRYLVSNIETRWKFHFITLGDLLLMQISGATVQSSHSLFRFLWESQQIKEPQMVDLLKKVYPVIEHHLGEVLRDNIPYVINHRYAYKGGGIHGKHAGIAIARINEVQDNASIYLSAGKMFYRCAEEILLHILFQLEPQFVEEDLTVEKKQVETYLMKYPLQVLIAKCLPHHKNQNFASFLKWWETLADSEKATWLAKLSEEIFRQQEMFFQDYPNPYILPTH